MKPMSVLVIALLAIGISPPSNLAQPIPTTQTQQNRKSDADRLAQQGLQQFQNHQNEAAIASWDAALKIYREIGDRLGEAITLNDQGRAYSLLSRPEESIQVYNQALSIFRQLKHRKGEASVLMNRASAYTDLSRYEAAIQEYNQALPIFQAIKDRQGEARLLMNRSIADALLSRYDDAIAGFNAALKIFQTLNARNDEAMALLNLGIAYDSTSRYNDAIAAFKNVLPIFRELNDRQSEVSTLSSLGNVYRNLSRFQEALTVFDEALTIAQAIKNREGEAAILMNRGVVYDLLARDDEAIAAYTDALKVFRAIRNLQGEAEALSNLGIIYASLGRYNESIQTHTEALALFRTIKNRNGEALTLMNRGIVYHAVSRYEDALNAYREALPIHRATQDRNGEARIFLHQGNTYTALKRYEDAIRAYRQALPIYRATQDRSGEAKTLYNLGVVYLDTGVLAQAEQSLRNAIAIFEAIRLDKLSEANKISFFETQAVSYQMLQEVLVTQKQFETALTVSEWGRTKALVERLSQQLQPTVSQVPQPAPNLSTLQQIARSQNATLVEYSLNEQIGQLYIWVIQSTGAVNFRQVNLKTALPKDCSSISQLIGNSRSSIGVRSPQSDWLIVDATTQKNPCAQSDSDENFRTLHQLLIEPIASLLPSDPNQHVVFVPDRSLFLVPFAALKAENGQFLIEQHTLRTASSIQLLEKTHALKSRPKSKDALIVGNPFMPNDPTATQVKQLSNLPNAEQEALAIAPLFNTQAKIGKHATKKAILQKMNEASVIHFATHGAFDDRNGFRSWLALAPSDRDNGILMAEEVAQLKLNADLVVLSACDTGRGKVTGDGVVGFSRSFIAAGVPSVIVSLWAVPDAPTAKLMKEFYQQLQRNPDKAQALRQAMVLTLKTHPNPKDWAAFTLIGEAR